MKQIFILTIALLTSFSGNAQIPANGLVARYDFNSASTFLDDAGSNNYDLCNTTSVTLVAGRNANDNAAAFTGTNYLYYCNGTSGGSSQFVTTHPSVAVWFKTTQSSGYGALATLRITGSPHNAFCLYIQTGQLAGFVMAPSANLTATTTINNGSWHHAVLTRDVNDLKLYIDGVLSSQTTFTGSLNFPNDVFTIGAASGGGDNFEGDVSQVLYYGRTLTATEVTQIYNESTITTGLNKQSALNPELLVYPNPVHDLLNISTSENAVNEEIKITTILGAVVYTQKAGAGANSVNVSSLAKGVYMIHTAGRTTKFVKE